MPLRHPNERLAVIGSSVAAVTGIVLGFALHPDYDEGLARSSPRQVLNGPVAASGRDVRLPFGLSVTVARPPSPLAPPQLAAARVRPAAASTVLADATPQDEPPVAIRPARVEDEGAADDEDMNEPKA